MTTNFINGQDTREAQQLAAQQIMLLGSALFFTQSRALLKLPVHVVKQVMMDEDFQIWFLVQKPTQELSEFEKKMPARMDFFKKGMTYNMKVEGVAHIIDDVTAINRLSAGQPVDGLIAMKVVINSTEYFETQPRPKKSWLQLSKQYLNSMFW